MYASAIASTAQYTGRTSDYFPLIASNIYCNSKIYITINSSPTESHIISFYSLSKLLRFSLSANDTSCKPSWMSISGSRSMSQLVFYQLLYCIASATLAKITRCREIRSSLPRAGETAISPRRLRCGTITKCVKGIQGCIHWGNSLLHLLSEKFSAYVSSITR